MNILLYRGNFNGNRSVLSNFMSDTEYSVIKSDVIKSFDCTSVCKDGTQVRWKIKEVRFYFDYLVSVSCLSNLKKLVLWCKFL